jgi:hypothetical protein
MVSTAIRRQRDQVGTDGELCQAWEFDYHLAKFYIQETDKGYVVIEETKPKGGWKLVRPERRQMIVAEFETARRRRRR